MIEELQKNCIDILKHNFELKDNNRVHILFDTKSKMSVLLKEAYEKACQKLANSHDLVDFYKQDIDWLIEDIQKNYYKEDVVVLIQSDSFRVSKYRWRNELCSKGLKVIEHSHLKKIKEKEIETYIKSLTFDTPHYKELCKKLCSKLEKTRNIEIISKEDSIAKYSGEMEKCVVNTGDFRKQTQYASRYPIGEIITESKDLSKLNGEVEVYAFPNLKQETKFVESFKCTFKNGFLTKHNGPKEFQEIINMIKTENEEGLIYVRELGLGLNRYIKRFDKLGDPIAYERQEGLHFSLGMKHGLFQKKLWPKYGKKFYQRYHIDIYVNVKEIKIDQKTIYTYDKGFFLD